MRFDVIFGTRLSATGNASMGIRAKQSDSLDQQGTGVEGSGVEGSGVEGSGSGLVLQHSETKN